MKATEPDTAVIVLGTPVEGCEGGGNSSGLLSRECLRVCLRCEFVVFNRTESRCWQRTQ